jgi:hypothetical protein
MEVYDGPVGVIVPDPGQGVHISAYGELGSAEFDVSTDLQGTVTLRHVGPDTGVTAPQATTVNASADLSLAAPDACEDAAYNVNTWYWFDPYPWYFRAGSTPSEMTAATAAWEFVNAVDEVVSSTRCNLEDKVIASAAYGGYASNDDDIYITTTPNGTKKARCEYNDDTDDVSIVGFGNLPVREENGVKNYLALTCTWREMMPVPYRPAAVESDQRLNKEDFGWGASPLPSGCGRYSVQAVATHEFGHTFGLAHVSEADHGKLTMSTASNGPCQDSEESFGKGDILGMRAQY